MKKKIKEPLKSHEANGYRLELSSHELAGTAHYEILLLGPDPAGKVKLYPTRSRLTLQKERAEKWFDEGAAWIDRQPKP